MKVSEVLRRLRDDGWVQVKLKGGTASSNIRRSPVA